MDDRRRGSFHRWRVDTVGTWWFLAAGALLYLNDQVLKHRHPGWITGKVSDVVGPLVVAGLLATLVGRRPAVVLTALGFAVVKTVPGAAEAVAPVLGGTTRRDPTDLIGLVGLVPLWFTPSRAAPARTPTTAPDPATDPATDGATAVRHQVGAALRTTWRRRVLPVCAPVVAVVALTATSQANPPEVRSLATDGTTIYAEVGVRGSYSATDVSWAASTDGGRTWEATAAPGAEALAAMVRSQEEACRADGACVAARGATVQEHDGDGGWRSSYRLSDDQIDVLDYRRFGGGTPVDELFRSVLVAPLADGEVTLVAASDQGVMRRSSTNWDQVAVLGASPTPTSGATWPLDAAGVALRLSAPVAFVGLSVRALARGGGGARVLGSIAGAVLVGLAIWSVGVGIWFAGTFTAQHPVLLAGGVFVIAAAVVVVPLAFVKTISRDVLA